MKTRYLILLAFTAFTFIHKSKAQCINPTISLNLPDTTIAFKKDSIQLDAGAGFNTYTWSNGANTRTIWVKNDNIYKVIVTANGATCGIDSTKVLFIKGIQPRDTTICKGSSIQLKVLNSYPKNGLVAWYPFNNNANDESGNGNNGTIVGANFVNDRNNESSSALNFNGSSNYVIINDNDKQDLNNDFSISSWIYANSFSSISTIVNKHGNGSQFDGYCFGVWKVSNNYLINCQGAPSYGSMTYPNANGKVNLSDWINLTSTYSKNSRILKYYINGNLIDSVIVDFSSIGNTAWPLIIGALGTPSNMNWYFNGKIDDVGIWNRSLESYEVNDLINSNKSIVKVIWNNNDTNNKVMVNPDSKTTYSCEILIGSYKLRDSINIDVSKPIIGNMIGRINELIIDTSYLYAVNAQIGYQYNWIVSNGVIVSGQETNSIYVKWINNGLGEIKVAVINTKGCSDTLSKSVKIGNVGVQEFGIHNVTIFPNPNNGSFSVSLINGIEENLCFQIHDLMGREFLNTIHFSKQGAQEIILNTNLNKGLYILTVIGSKTSLKKQILIN